jgi:FemAB-related protein (PEP-CTERM system-associated)
MLDVAQMAQMTTMAPMATKAPAAVVVSVATEADRGAWDAYVDAHLAPARTDARAASRATGYHSWAWRDVFARSFSHDNVYLIARRAASIEIDGVLPLTEVRSLLFGRSLTSLPFLNYGGVVSDSDEAARALVDEAARVARARGCRHVELRHIERRFTDLPCKQHKVTMRLPLHAGMWDRLDRKVRNQIRKAEKSGLTAVSGGAELLGEFYRVFARNMRDLGTPVYARRFFAEVLAAFPDRTRLVVVRLKDRPVAAALTYRTGGQVEVPWASSVRDYNALCPNHLLYWTVLDAAVAAGCDLLDFGRSTPDEGTYKFKAQWGAEPVPLHWEYAGLDGGPPPDQSPKNPKFRLAIATWQRLPLWIANAAGPGIVKGIP